MSYAIRQVPNDDRYMKCASCAASAVALLTVERDGQAVTLPVVRRFQILEPVQVVDGQYVRGDVTIDLPLVASVCTRHAQLHARRLIAAAKVAHDA